MPYSDRKSKLDSVADLDDRPNVLLGYREMEPKEFDIRVEALRAAIVVLKAARAETGLTRVAFAKRCGIAASTLDSIENGRTQNAPSIQLLMKACVGAGKKLKLTIGD